MKLEPEQLSFNFTGMPIQLYSWFCGVCGHFPCNNPDHRPKYPKQVPTGGG